MSNENITPEILEYADICRRIMVGIYRDGILTGDFDEEDTSGMEKALSQYRLCLEIMKLEKEL